MDNAEKVRLDDENAAALAAFDDAQHMALVGTVLRVARENRGVVVRLGKPAGKRIPYTLLEGDAEALELCCRMLRAVYHEDYIEAR